MSTESTPSVSKETSPVKESVESPNASSSSENVQEEQNDKKKQPVLTPAPLPTKSPWKSVSADIPISTIPVETLESSKKKKNKSTAPVIKSNSTTKWVPMKASFVVSGSKRPGSGSKKNTVKSYANGNGKSNNISASKKKKQQQQSKKQQPKSSNDHEEKSSKGETSLVAESLINEISAQKGLGDQQNVQAENLANKEQPKSPMISNQYTSNIGEKSGNHQQRRHNHNNQFQHYAHQQNGFPRRRYYNNEAFKQQSFPSNPQQAKNTFMPYQGRVPRSFNHNSHPRYHQHPQSQQQMAPMYQQYYPIDPAVLAVNSIAKQIEYYFSTENLTNDNYLRSKLSKEGYASLALIAKFYRVVNMSLGGDPDLILASLREIVADEHATVEVAFGSIVNPEHPGSNSGVSEVEDESPLTNYFIRSKDWPNSLPEKFSTVVSIERTLKGNALDEFMINLASIPLQAPIYEETMSRLEDDSLKVLDKEASMRMTNGEEKLDETL